MAWCGGGAAASGGVGEEAVRPALSSARRLPARPRRCREMPARRRGLAPLWTSTTASSSPGGEEEAARDAGEDGEVVEEGSGRGRRRRPAREKRGFFSV